MYSQTKKLTTIGMLCALAYASTVIGRVPLVLFLKYDPKDIIIAISGLVLGPLTSFSVALIVSLVEMFTISENGVLGLLMNVISSCSFACTTAFVYKKKRKLSGAITGLFCGWGCMVFVMLLWNYLITPIYMGYPREAVVELLIPAFLPFNLIKGGLNTAITMILYKPIVTSLRHTHFTEANQIKQKVRLQVGLILTAFSIITICILLFVSMKGVFGK